MAFRYFSCVSGAFPKPRKLHPSNTTPGGSLRNTDVVLCKALGAEPDPQESLKWRISSGVICVACLSDGHSACEKQKTSLGQEALQICF